MAKINFGYGLVRMPATTHAPCWLRSTELKPLLAKTKELQPYELVILECQLTKQNIELPKPNFT